MILSPTDQNTLAGMRAAGACAAHILHRVLQAVEPGVTTGELDALAMGMMEGYGAQSAPMVTYNFPGATCISVNDEIAHGIPGPRVLAKGDVVNVDVSLSLHGFFSDNAATLVVPPIPQELDALVQAARRARDTAIARISHGVPFRLMGRVFQLHARRLGVQVMRDLCSHGIGLKLHEDPSEILGYEDRRDTRRFQTGQVLTVEPFLSTGNAITRTAEDGWTLMNAPGKHSAQFEHTIWVQAEGPPEIFTTLPKDLL